MELGVDYVDIELKVCLYIGNFLTLTICYSADICMIGSQHQTFYD
jgi:hypothetical protein